MSEVELIESIRKNKIDNFPELHDKVIMLILVYGNNLVFRAEYFGEDDHSMIIEFIDYTQISEHEDPNSIKGMINKPPFQLFSKLNQFFSIYSFSIEVKPKFYVGEMVVEIPIGDGKLAVLDHKFTFSNINWGKELPEGLQLTNA